MKWDEKKISQLYQIGKQVDDGSIAPFERVLARSWTTPRTISTGVFRLIGVLAVVLVMIAIALVRIRSRPADSLASRQITTSLLRWRSPTDFLLQTPGHELRDSLPQVGRPLASVANSNQGFSQSRGEKR